MSKTLNKIKQDQLDARKAKDTVRSSLLTTLLGEASPSGTQTVSEDNVIEVVKKFYKNLAENREIYVERNQSTDGVDAEISIILEYLPSQLTVEEIEEIVDDLIVKYEIKNMGGMKIIMPYMIENYTDRYNGKEVKKIVQSKLG